MNVDSGTFEETIVKSGTKINHLCHIGHNAIVGTDCLITAGTVFVEVAASEKDVGLELVL